MASDALGEAYVVPFDKILQDIKHSLGALSICLPTRSEISAWQRVSRVDLSSNILPARRINSLPGVDTAWHRGSHENLSINRLPGPRIPRIHSPASVDSGYETASVRSGASGQSGASLQSSLLREDLKSHELPEEDELLEEEDLEHIGKKGTLGNLPSFSASAM